MGMRAFDATHSNKTKKDYNRRQMLLALANPGDNGQGESYTSIKQHKACLGAQVLSS